MNTNSGILMDEKDSILIEKKETGRKRSLSLTGPAHNNNVTEMIGKEAIDTIDLTNEDESDSAAVSEGEEGSSRKRTKVSLSKHDSSDPYPNQESRGNELAMKRDVRELLEYSSWSWAYNQKERDNKRSDSRVTSLLEDKIVELYEGRKDRNTVKGGALGSKQLYNFVVQKLENDDYKYSATDGKWLLMNISWNDIVTIWNKIYIATTNGELGCTSKVGKMSTGETPSYMICVYTNDFRDRKKLEEVLNKLANLGVLIDSSGNEKRTIPYKADLITCAFSGKYGTSSIDNGTFWEGKNVNGQWTVQEPQHFRANNGLGAKVSVKGLKNQFIAVHAITKLLV